MDKLINKIKDSFTIQDLEILTGIKAHTIRIWEKRYELLNPTRLNRNVRTYNLSDLQKILNVSLLYKRGHKISKISKLSDNQIAEEAKVFALRDFSNTYEINSLIICMYTFDQKLFHEIYKQQSEKLTFRQIFTNTYIPLLNHLGLLWQTDSIKPVHEHFVSNLIYQKIALNIAKIPSNKKSNNPINVLFLPYGEIHELGLLFLNYYLKLVGQEVIYLGKSIPFDNLFYLNSQIKSITWITYFMIDKTKEEKDEFILSVSKLLEHTKNKCIIVGNIWEEYRKKNTNEQIIFKSKLEELVSVNEAKLSVI
ncbi:MAG: MerR family transcriptional regulator [Flavobacteriales bacterium]|nr:MAG: MerR family transcriptional regulator [Flavobacteriales bacterium]